MVTQEREIQKIKDDVGYIKKSLAGNGEEGLIKCVGRNTRFRISARAQLSMIKWLVGIAASTGIFNLLYSLVHIP